MNAPRPLVPVSLLPDDAPFTPEQRAWLSGFLMAVLAPADATAREEARSAGRLAILYASQTGTAEGLARKLGKAAKARGFDATPHDLGALSLQDLAALGTVTVIAATHGDGDPPDSAVAFARALKEASGTPLVGLRYAVLALGDRTYPRFCQFGAFLDQRFSELGAERVADLVSCDGDPTPQFAEWRDATLTLLTDDAEAPAVQIATAANSDFAFEDDIEPLGTRANPFVSEILDNRVLNAAGSDKEVRHIALSLDGAPFDYAPGDALGVVPENPPDMVEAILAASGLTGDTPVTVDREMPFVEALTHHVSIGRLTQPTLIKFAQRANDPDLSKLVEPGRGDALAQYLLGRDVIDLLVRYPGVIESAPTLVALLPRLNPRLYSISSSLRMHPGEVHLTVAAVRYQSHGRDRVGIASGFLATRCLRDPVRIYVQRNARFRLPEDSGVPVVMIGPGTGIAPFRAFLQERRATGAQGRNWLFFGDRREATDYLYRSELEQFVKHGTLTLLDTAFSRDQAQKIYVQTRMMEHGAKLWHWLRDGAHIYVCGDATHMAKDVDRALRAIIARYGHMSDAEAQLELNQMVAAGRYSRDVY